MKKLTSIKLNLADKALWGHIEYPNLLGFKSEIEIKVKDKLFADTFYAYLGQNYALRFCDLFGKVLLNYFNLHGCDLGYSSNSIDGNAVRINQESGEIECRFYGGDMEEFCDGEEPEFNYYLYGINNTIKAAYIEDKITGKKEQIILNKDNDKFNGFCYLLYQLIAFNYLDSSKLEFAVQADLDDTEKEMATSQLKKYLPELIKNFKDDGTIPSEEILTFLGSELYVCSKILTGQNLTLPFENELPEIEANISLGNFGASVISTSSKVVKTIKAVKDYVKSKEFYVKGTSKEDAKLIPEKYLDYIPNNDLVIMANVVHSEMDIVKNFMITGEAGTGKSTASQMLATMTHLPYRFMTLSADTASGDLLLNLLPKGDQEENKKVQAKAITKRITLLEEVKKQVLEELKKDKEYASKTEAELIEIANDFAIEGVNGVFNNSNNFLQVESEFVKTFRNGGIIEVQEANCVRKGSVLTAFNAALDELQELHLVNGETIKRHKNCIVVFTANIGYEGTSPMNKALISRCFIYSKFELPENVVLANRIAKETGVHKDTILKMVNCFEQIRNKLEIESELEGICSYRELKNWVHLYKLIGDAKKSCELTCINKATNDDDLNVELKQIVANYFA